MRYSLMILIGGTNNPELAKNLSNKIHAKYVQADVQRFEDQELRIQINEPLNQKDVIIFGSTSKPANDHLMEILLITDTAKRAGAKNIIAVMPYFGYSRQDRPSYNHGPISISLIATLLEAAGITKIITIDLHSKQSEGFFRIGVQNLDSTNLFTKFFKNTGNLTVVSPDIGGVARAQAFCKALNCDLAIINKTRKQNNECVMDQLIGNVNGKNCIIVDDIVDTAGTLCKAVDLLIRNGAKSVDACITHPVFSKNAMVLISKSALGSLYVSDSIIHGNLSPKVKIVHVVDLLAKALLE